MTALRGRLVLPPDVILAPVGDLAEEVRQKLAWSAGDHAITRPRLRAGSRLVDADAANLLRQFTAPSTVIEAVLRESRARGADPETLLDAAFPFLARMAREGFLAPVDGDGDGGGAIEASRESGERLAGYTVLRCVQILEDTEVYQVRSDRGPGPLAGDAGDPWRGARREAALKIEKSEREGSAPAAGLAARLAAGPGAAGRRLEIHPGPAARLVREAAVLQHLAAGPGARIAPLLLGAGIWRERCFLAFEWCSGVDAETAAAELREAGGEDGEDGRRAALLDLCRAIAAAYASLHRRGILHGDVHPGNILVDAAGAVRLLDFGLARCPGLLAVGAAERGGVAFYHEPEHARALVARGPVPPATMAGEVYALGALFYKLVTGAYYLDFSLARDTLLRQIAAAPPLPFAAAGAAAWPDLEALLARALAKDPGRRPADAAELAAALAAIAPPVPAVPSAPRPDHPRALPAAVALGRPLGAAAAWVAASLAAARPDGPIWRAPSDALPLASLQYGSAGVAHALYRIAVAREDPDLLTQADLWRARAVAASAAGDAAFYDPRLDLTRHTVGTASLLHGPPGVHLAALLIANARGDETGAARAAAAYTGAARQPCAEVDLAIGRSGLLAGCAVALEALGGAGASAVLREAAAALVAAGDALLAGLAGEIAPLPAIPDAPARLGLGVAHGWGGVLYALLRWCRAAARPLPVELGERLAQLAACGESCRRGLRWRWYDPGRDAMAAAPGEAAPAAAWMAGWCNGSAGLSQLWTLAARVLGDERYLRLAVAAGWHVWETADGGASLCCGLAGRAYALLDLHRHGAGAEWLARARALAHRAAAAAGATGTAGAGEGDEDHPAFLLGNAALAALSLYRGRLGAAVLMADLERPEGAAMPVFGEEGWPRGVC